MKTTYRHLLILLFCLTCLSNGNALADTQQNVAAPMQQATLTSERENAPATQRLLARMEEQQRELHRLSREIALLSANQKKPGLTEVLGGLGYIIGLCGLYAWARSRDKGHS